MKYLTQCTYDYLICNSFQFCPVPDYLYFFITLSADGCLPGLDAVVYLGRGQHGPWPRVLRGSTKPTPTLALCLAAAQSGAAPTRHPPLPAPRVVLRRRGCLGVAPSAHSPTRPIPENTLREVLQRSACSRGRRLVAKKSPLGLGGSMSTQTKAELLHELPACLALVKEEDWASQATCLFKSCI